MTLNDSDIVHHRAVWRELSQNLTQREILYYISGSPDGVRESKIKTHMKEEFKYSFHGSIDSHLKQMESDGLITRESTRSGAVIWHADPYKVIGVIRNELAEMKIREGLIRDLEGFLSTTYDD